MRHAALTVAVAAASLSPLALAEQPAQVVPQPGHEHVVPRAKFLRAVTLYRREKRLLAATRVQLADARAKVRLIDHPTPAGNRRIARLLFGARDYACAKVIIDGESGWNERIANREGSGAYGLGQALPRTKMLAYGRDAYTNPLVQLVWMRAYAESRYGGLCPAAAHWTPRRSW